jgi:hypothetical protein
VADSDFALYYTRPKRYGVPTIQQCAFRRGDESFIVDVTASGSSIPTMPSCWVRCGEVSSGPVVMTGSTDAGPFRIERHVEREPITITSGTRSWVWRNVKLGREFCRADGTVIARSWNTLTLSPQADHEEALIVALTDLLTVRLPGQDRSDSRVANSLRAFGDSSTIIFGATIIVIAVAALVKWLS